MDAEKKSRLEAAGFRVGTVAEFLELTPEENEMLETRVALAKLVRTLRAETGVTQQALAERIGSSQSRLAKLEGNDPSVSVELMLRTLFALGANRKQISEALTA